MPAEAKGGTFAPADMKLIKHALNMLLEDEYIDESTEFEYNKIVNLLHRIERISKEV